MRVPVRTAIGGIAVIVVATTIQTGVGWTATTKAKATPAPTPAASHKIKGGTTATTVGAAPAAPTKAAPAPAAAPVKVAPAAASVAPAAVAPAAPPACTQNTDVIGAYHFLVNGAVVGRLSRTSVHSGDSVEVVFTVKPGCTADAKLETFKKSTAPGVRPAGPETLFASAAGTNLTSGQHSLGPIKVPPCYFEVDFFARASGNAKYFDVDSSVGGTASCTPPPPPPTVVITGACTAAPNNTASIVMTNNGPASLNFVVTRSDSAVVDTVPVGPASSVTKTYTFTSATTFTVTPAGGTAVAQSLPNSCSTVLPLVVVPAAVAPADVVEGTDVPDATLPATGSGRVLPDLELGFGLILLGAAVLLVSGRRRHAAAPSGRHFSSTS